MQSPFSSQSPGILSTKSDFFLHVILVLSCPDSSISAEGLHHTAEELRCTERSLVTNEIILKQEGMCHEGRFWKV